MTLEDRVLDYLARQIRDLPEHRYDNKWTLAAIAGERVNQMSPLELLQTVSRALAEGNPV